MSGSKRARPLRRAAIALAALLLGTMAALAVPAAGSAATGLPANFTDSVIASGLDEPTAVQFAPDGHVFIAEKSGLVKVLDSVADPTPSVFADLRTSVHNFWDRGLLGLAIDPQWPARPYVYVLYSYNAVIGGTAPRWVNPGPAPDPTSDPCPSPPGATTDGCVISGRLSRLTAVPSAASPSGFAPAPTETVLINDWCQQFPSHSIGSLVFGADGSLFASAGEGAHFFGQGDYGQYGGTLPDPAHAIVPANPCGDPVGNNAPQTEEGGALRSQDVRTAGDPTGLDGSIIRVDPNTGAALPTNPAAGNSDPNTARIVAYGLRNPFRMTRRPGTGELWFGDVGWNTFEEINRLTVPNSQPVENFGWPCFEGNTAQPNYAAYGFDLCTSLAAGSDTKPYYSYDHAAAIAPNDGCSNANGSSTTGLAFYDGSTGNYPSSYAGALFFADQARQCIWVMNSTNGQPDKTKIQLFRSSAGNPVDLEIGPGGDLYYVDLAVGSIHGGSVHRVRYAPGNQAPVAVATAITPAYGPLPLTVTFDGTGSSDPDVEPLTYSWDLDGNGSLGDSTLAAPTHIYSSRNHIAVRLRVTDALDAFTDTTVDVYPGNAPPVPTISAPITPTSAWATGELISFEGSATDDVPDQVALTWQLILHHCPTGNGCHQHLIQTFTGPTGSFNVPDPDNPSFWELRLTATDPEGMTGTTSLSSVGAPLTFATDPPGLQVTAAGITSTSPLTRTLIAGSVITLSAPSSQLVNGVPYTFASWSDGGAQTHTVSAPDLATTYTAVYAAPPAPPVVPPPVVSPPAPGDTTPPLPAYGLTSATTFDSAGRPSTAARWFVPAAATDGTSVVRMMRGSAPTSLSQGVALAATARARVLGSTGPPMAVTLSPLRAGSTYGVSVFQVDAAGNASAPVSMVLSVPRVEAPVARLSTLRRTPVTVRWRLTGRTGTPIARRRVAVLVRAKGTSRWRTYRFVVTDANGVARVSAPVGTSTDFALRYTGSSTTTGVQSAPVLVTLRSG